MTHFSPFRCLLTSNLLAAALLIGAPVDASRAANGSETLINGKTGKCLTIAGGTSPANNLTAVQFDCDGDLSRSWHFNPAGNAFQIQNAKTGKCLTIAGGTSPANNLEAVQFDCDSDPSRRWRYTVVDATTFRLVNVHSGLCLTVAGGGTGKNTTAVQFPCDGDPSRDWQIR